MGRDDWENQWGISERLPTRQAVPFSGAGRRVSAGDEPCIRSILTRQAYPSPDALRVDVAKYPPPDAKRSEKSLTSLELPDMNDSIFIRAFEPRDLYATARLFDLYRQFYEQRPDLMQAEQFIRARMETGESVVLIADDGQGSLAGFCQLYPSFCSVEAGPIYVLYDLFVEPNARQRGIAKRLLAAAHERARADGKVRMDLTTAKTNLKAQALYESMGWRRDEVFFTYTLDVDG